MNNEHETSEKGLFTRRDFFRGSAALVGGVLVSQLPAEVSAYVAGDDAIKVAVIVTLEEEEEIVLKQ